MINAETQNYESLNKLYDDLSEKHRDGHLDDESKLLYIAAGYALDFMDTFNNGNELGEKLDLTVNSEQNTQLAIHLNHYSHLHAGKTVSGSRELLVKKLASYELFVLCNYLIQNGFRPMMKLEPNSIVIEVQHGDGIVSFDVLKRMKFTASRFELSEGGDRGGATFAHLNWFVDKVSKELLKPLEKD